MPRVTRSGLTPRSSRRISLDWALTTVTTFCRPLLVVTLSKVSSTLLPFLTISLKASSVAALRAGVGDFHRDVVALRAFGQRLHPEGTQTGRGAADAPPVLVVSSARAAGEAAPLPPMRTT